MKLIHIAKRRLDGLIDENWMAGLDAYRSNDTKCPHPADTPAFMSWVEGWTDASLLESGMDRFSTSAHSSANEPEDLEPAQMRQ
jgi:hypothetical protein